LSILINPKTFNITAFLIILHNIIKLKLFLYSTFMVFYKKKKKKKKKKNFFYIFKKKKKKKKIFKKKKKNI